MPIVINGRMESMPSMKLTPTMRRHQTCTGAATHRLWMLSSRLLMETIGILAIGAVGWMAA